MRGAAQRLDFLRSTYVGRAAPPVEENWDSEEDEGEVAAAEVMDKVEEPVEQWPAGPWHVVLPFVLFFVWLRVLWSFPRCSTFGRRGGGVAATEPDLREGTADRNGVPP